MTFDRTQLIRLIESLIEGRLNDEEIEQLESILRDDPQAKEFYTGYVFNHAALSLHAQGENNDIEELRILFGLDSTENPSSQAVISKGRNSDRASAKTLKSHAIRFLPLSALILTATFFSLFFFFTGGSEEKPSFATISRTTNCLWADSSTQTRVGSRLGRCVLNLEEGIAKIRFDCGVVVSLEGPSELEVRDEKYTVLRSGRLVASVEKPTGKGFVVDTPLGAVTDWGTQFGVHVPPKGPGSVHVLDGEVEVHARGARQGVFVQKGGFFELNDPRTRSESPDEAALNGNQTPPKIIQISSAQGRGAESWVIRNPKTIKTAYELFPYHVAQPYMLVKTSFESESDRKAIFRLDLAGLTAAEKREFETVSLIFSYGPTELGYASNVPVSEFTVYGLTVDAMDLWSEDDHLWSALPDNSDEFAALGPAWISLGSFSIEQGSRSGTIVIEGESLNEFVRKNGNDLISFAIIRDTEALVKTGLVHGFVNRYHPTQMPPRLVFQLKNIDSMNEVPSAESPK